MNKKARPSSAASESAQSAVSESGLQASQAAKRKAAPREVAINDPERSLKKQRLLEKEKAIAIVSFVGKIYPLTKVESVAT